MNIEPNYTSIVFICSALEPGKDGVGDYARRIAATLIKAGNKCAVLALNDRHIKTDFKGTQEMDDIAVPVMRIPSVGTNKERFTKAKDFIDDFNPDWLSLQFVPFGFHPKGLKLWLSKSLNALNDGRKWHIMIHELWVGMDKESPVKHMAWGWLQKQLIISLLKNLKPDAITTQALLYQLQLLKIGYQAKYLPLFSNIPVNYIAKRAAVNDDKSSCIVIFGNIHHSEKVPFFVKEVAEFGLKNNLIFNLKLLGQCGPLKDAWIENCRQNGLEVTLIGEQSAERISAELSNANFGITTTPLIITDKSGSFAAMRSHSLPVISVSREWHARGLQSTTIPDDVFYYQKGNFTQFFNSIKSFETTTNSVAAVSAKLFNILHDH